MNTKSVGTKVGTILLIAAMLLSSFPFTTVFAAPTPAVPVEPASAPPPAPPSGPAAFPGSANTARSERVDYAALGLVLEAAPFYAHVGDPVTVTLVLRNDGDLPLEGVVVSATVPAGLAEVRPSRGDYDQRAGRLTLPLPRLEVGQALTVTVTARVTGQGMQEGHAILWAEGRGGTLPFPVRDGALIVVGDPGREARGSAEFPAAQGGRLQAADGRVAVDFPPGAVNAPGLVRTGHVPWGLLRQERPAENLPRSFAGYYPTLPPFELTAQDDMGGPLRTFNQPVTITVSYDPAEIAALGLEEADLQLFWWDEDAVLTDTEGMVWTGRWAPIPSVVDFTRHVVVAAVDHFTNFSLSDGSSPSDAFLPSVEAFQVSLLTGGATAGYSINVPRGPGGLAPSLSLGYSSGATDGKGGSRNLQTSSWVGRGWSLGLDYIAVVKNPADGGVNHNTYSIVLNGVSSDLVVHNATENGLPNPHYHVADEQFWAVWQQNVGAGTHYKNGAALQDTVWYVQTKDGALYQFGSTTAGDFGNRSWWAWDRSNNGATPGCGSYLETYRWFLTKVTDTHGNEMDYTYNHAGSSVNYSACGGSVQGYTVGDVWPETIQWGSSVSRRFQVTFESSARSDDTSYERAPALLGQGPHDTRQLDGIRAESMRSSSWELVRRYDFTYDYSLRPDTNTNYPKLTLKQVQMTGADGYSTLPATTYTYYGNVANGKYRLQTANNGYGGTVTYAYYTWSLNGNSRNRVTTRTVGDGLGHNYVWSYAYTNAADNNQTYSAAIWYDLHVVGDTSYLVHSPYSEFRGFRKVEVTDPNGNKTEHWFYQGDGYDDTHSACTIGTWSDACALRRRDQEALLGKEWKTISHSSSTSVIFEMTVNDFTVEHYDNEDSPTGVRWTFSYLSQVVATTYDGDSSPRYRTTQYAYNPAYQGGTQWGNQTHTWEYGERTPGPGVDPLRTTTRWYVPNTTGNVWIVGAPAVETVFDGPEASTTWQALMFYGYDDQAPYYAPTVGELTRVMTAKALDTGTWLATTVDVAYDYDLYGNRTAERHYNDEGHCRAYADSGAYDPATADLRETLFYYDSTYHVYPTSVTYPNGRSETAEYDLRMGLVTLYTDVNADPTSYRYDTLGRFWKLWKPGDSESQPTVLNAYEFDTLDQFPVMWAVWYKGDTNAGPWTVGGTWERRFYDGLGRVVETQRPDYDWTGAANTHEIVAYTVYDGLGQPTAASVPYQRTAYQYAVCNGKTCTPYGAPDLNQPKTQYAYDPVGRVTQVTNPDNSTVRTTYSKWVTWSYDEANHQGYQETDALGRLLYVREYTGANPYTWYTTTTYGYDIRDQLTDVWDEAGNHTQLTYDKLGRKTAMSDPDMGSWSYAYDNVGNMTTQTDAKNQVSNFSYDILNRVTLKDLPGTASDVTFCYDNCLGDAGTANSYGKLRRAYVGTGATTNAHQYKYDTRGRTSWEQVTLDTVNYITSYTYDSADRGKTMTYPGGEVVTNAYRPNGQLNIVSGSLGDVYVGSVTYTPWGAPDIMKLGASGTPIVQVDYNYYAWNGADGEGRARLSQVTAGVATDLDSLQDLRYTYDLAGNVETIQDYKVTGGTQTQTYTYDDLDRLLSAVVAGGSGGQGQYSEAYTYTGNNGKIGNLTSKGSNSYTYGAQEATCPGGALTKPHAVVQAGTLKFCYDANGNMVKRNNAAYTLVYDAENRLTTVSGSATADFVYGPGGERVKGTVGSTITYYIGAHYEKQGTTIRKYYYAGGTRVAVREGTTLSWLLSDQLGSTAITANGTTGAKVAEVRYKAFGEDRYTSGATPTTFRYTGQRQESLIGLYYYGARWYDPALARWTAPDSIVSNPANPQSLNRFSYVLNNPLRYSDPTGHRDEEGTGMEEPVPPPPPHKPPTIDTTYLGTDNNDGARADGVNSILGIVMHKTGYDTDTVAGVVSHFQNTDVGANYLIDKEGTIYQLTEDSQFAYHAGGWDTPSEWNPIGPNGRPGETVYGDNISKATIGIEVLGASGEPYTAAQEEAAKYFVGGLAFMYNIDPRNITSHKLVSEEGKPDGNEYLGQLRDYVSSRPQDY